MPTISMFYGIIISLYFYDDERHKLPHIHAKYQGRDASFSILDTSVLAGEIPVAKARLVQAWIEIHRESLLADWELAVNGQTPFVIEPLRQEGLWNPSLVSYLGKTFFWNSGLTPATIVCSMRGHI